MFHQQFASGSPWLGVAVAVLVVHAATLVYAWLRRPDGMDASAGRGSPPAEGTTPARSEEGDPVQNPEDNCVRCRDCGAENEAGYRFCRACVSELPGGARVVPQGAQSSGRFVQ